MIKIRVTLILLTWNEIAGVRELVPKISREWVDEIICVDGGSTDGTVEWMKEHRIPVYFQERRGRAEAFRVGLAKAKGDIPPSGSVSNNGAPPHVVRIASKRRNVPPTVKA